MRLIVLLMAVLSFGFSGTIEPYGGVKWEASPDDVLAFLCKSEDISEIGISARVKAAGKDMIGSSYVPKEEACNLSGAEIVDYAFGIREMETAINSDALDRFEKGAYKTVLLRKVLIRHLDFRNLGKEHNRNDIFESIKSSFQKNIHR